MKVAATHIVIIEIEHNRNARKICEQVENGTFKDQQELFKNVPTEYHKDITVMVLTDFMDSVNNNEINFKNHYISYIQLLKF